MRTSGNGQRAGRRRISRRDAELLLDAALFPPAPGGSDAAGSGLGRLLSEAAGPALDAELGGEAEARAGYLAAHRPSVATSKENRVFSKLLLTKAAAVKVSAAFLGLSVCGVATAAETGALPDGLQKTAHSAFGAVGVPAAKDSAKKDSDHDASKSGGGVSLGPGKGQATATAPKPSSSRDGDADGADRDRDRRDGDGAALLGGDAGWLCRAAANGDKDDHGVDLDAARLQKLAKAAGVPDDQIAKIKSRIDAEQARAQKQIQDFCTRLDAAMKAVKDGKVPPFPLPPIHPGPGWPTSWPTTWPSGLPTGLPSSWPSDWPSKWPTGLPTGVPSIPGHLPTSLPSLPFPTDPIHPPMPSGSVTIVHH